MNLNKIQNLVQKVSQSQKVKKVVADLQTMSADIQKRVNKVNTDQAVKKYKEIMKKISTAEGELEKELSTVIGKLKKSATEVEKNYKIYKKKAYQQKSKIEKILKNKTVVLSAEAKVKPKKSTGKTKARKKAIRK